MNENDVNISTPFDDSVTLSETVNNTRTSLHFAIEQRKQTERDAQLLMNRIQLLKNEEAKALKNIAITKARAMNTQSIKRESALREAERFEIERRRQSEFVSVYQRNSYLRDAAKANRAASFNELQKSKVQAAYETRAAIRNSAIQRITELETEKKKATRRTELIKQERIDAKKRLETERIQRLRKFQLEYEARLVQEEQLKLQSESFLSQLEKEELELIRRLERVQQQQSLVYEEFSSTLPPSTPPATLCKSTSALTNSSRNSPIISSRIARSHYAPTLASLSRRDVGGAALR
jgi:hypothetical protein